MEDTDRISTQGAALDKLDQDTGVVVEGCVNTIVDYSDTSSSASSDFDYSVLPPEGREAIFPGEEGFPIEDMQDDDSSELSSDSDQDMESLYLTGDLSKDKSMFAALMDIDDDDDSPTLLKTKNEMDPDELYVDPVARIPSDQLHLLQPAGVVISVLDKTFVVQTSDSTLSDTSDDESENLLESHPPASASSPSSCSSRMVGAPDDTQALDLNNAIYLADGTPVGRVEDVFGLVCSPLYAVRVAAELGREYPLAPAFTTPDMNAVHTRDVSLTHTAPVACVSAANSANPAAETAETAETAGVPAAAAATDGSEDSEGTEGTVFATEEGKTHVATTDMGVGSVDVPVMDAHTEAVTTEAAEAATGIETDAEPTCAVALLGSPWLERLLLPRAVDCGLRVGARVFYCTGEAQFVLASQLYLPGSDASNLFDEEVDAEHQEFSDDEKEQEYRRAKAQSKGNGGKGASASKSAAQSTSVHTSMKSARGGAGGRGAAASSKVHQAQAHHPHDTHYQHVPPQPPRGHTHTHVYSSYAYPGPASYAHPTQARPHAMHAGSASPPPPPPPGHHGGHHAYSAAAHIPAAHMRHAHPLPLPPPPPHTLPPGYGVPHAYAYPYAPHASPPAPNTAYAPPPLMPKK